MRAHLVYSKRYGGWLADRNFAHFFIYRDPRDVVVSEAHYLTRMNRWHRLHKYFKSLDTVEDRISFSIMGHEFLDVPYDYPNIAERFRRYMPWIDHDDVCAVKFEDLLAKAETTVAKMVRYYARKSGRNFDASHVTEQAIQSINPENSHTYRRGDKCRWKKTFTEEHKRQFKEIAGDLLIELGYVNNKIW